MNAYIFTLPHYTPDYVNSVVIGERLYRYCDEGVLQFAEKMSSYIKNKGHHCIIIKGDIPRSNIDLNKSVSRNTDFRKDIINTINKLHDGTDYKMIYLIDIHSFYENYHNLYKNEIILLYDRASYLSLYNSIQNKLKYFKISSRIMQSQDNDIIDEVNEYIIKKKTDKIRTILLQFDTKTFYPNVRDGLILNKKLKLVFYAILSSIGIDLNVYNELNID